MPSLCASSTAASARLNTSRRTPRTSRHEAGDGIQLRDQSRQQRFRICTQHSRALIRKVGILKCYWDDQTKYETHDLTGIDDAALNALMADPAAEVQIVQSEMMGEPQVDPMSGQIVPPPAVHAVRVMYTHPDGRVKLEAVPPEEFLISREAKSVEEADYLAHRRLLTVSELVAMGYDEDEVDGLASGHADATTNIDKDTQRS